MEKPINERLSSRIPFPKELQLGQDVVITIDGHHIIGNVVKVSYEDQQDGSANVIYSVKHLSE